MAAEIDQAAHPGDSHGDQQQAFWLQFPQQGSREKHHRQLEKGGQHLRDPEDAFTGMQVLKQQGKIGSCAHCRRGRR